MGAGGGGGGGDSGAGGCGGGTTGCTATTTYGSAATGGTSTAGGSGATVPRAPVPVQIRVVLDRMDMEAMGALEVGTTEAVVEATMVEEEGLEMAVVQEDQAIPQER